MPTHSVQILYVNSSPPIGADKQVNITGTEMQKDFWCVDVLIQYVPSASPVWCTDLLYTSYF